MDSWLTPGSVILHNFELHAGGEEPGGGHGGDVQSMARAVAAGGLFQAGAYNRHEQLRILFLSRCVCS
jgi:hypothetical protein